MRSHFVKDDLIAVSANNMEAAINSEQTLDTGMLADLESLPVWDARKESNADEATGKEEPDAIYDLGGLSTMELSFNKMQVQHMAMIGSYGLAVSSSVAAGSTGWKRTITPISGDLDSARSNPSFTLACRYGKHLEKRRFASFFVDSFTLSLKKDSWASLKASIKGTGKNATNLCKETVSGFYDSTSLTLAANGLAGATAQERLDNVHHIRVQVPVTLEWVDVVCTAASDASPAVLTIAAPGGTHTACNYEIIYNIKETGTYAWCSFPSRVSEPPLRVSDFLVNIGGKWDGSAITGGRQLSADINSMDWVFNNKLTPDFVPGGGTYSYANRGLRQGREQKITLDRRFMDYIVGQRFYDLETFVFYAKAEGPEYEAGHKYTLEVVFPKVAVMARPIGRDGNRLSEKVDLLILEDDTYGSVILYTKNKVQNYAQ